MKYLIKLIKSLKEIIIITILEYIVLLLPSFIYYSITKGNIEDFILNYGSIILIIFDILLIIYLITNYKRKESKINKNSYLPLILTGIFLATFLNMLIFKLTTQKEVITISFILSLVASSFIGPIMEELMFRYIFLNKLLTFNTKKISILINLIVFALFHSGLTTMIYAFILGLFLNYVYLKYQNIKASIILHISANLIVSFLTGYNPYILLISLIGLIISILLLKKDGKNYEKVF